MKYAVVLIFLVVVATGAGLLYLQPWVRDVTPLAPADFALQMNALTGPEAPDTSSRSAKLVEVVMQIKDLAHRLDEEVVESEGFNVMEDGDLLPSSAVSLVLESPPRQLEIARRCVEKFEESGTLAVLDDMATQQPLAIPWSAELPVMDQFNERMPHRGAMRAAYRVLVARMRLADLDKDWDRSFRSLRTLLWLGRSMDLHPMFIDVLTAVATRGGILEELRCQIMDHHVPEDGLAACEALLAGISFDDAGWISRIDRVARGEWLFSQATVGESLESDHLNSRVNRRRVSDDWEQALVAFRAAAALPADKPISGPAFDPLAMIAIAQEGTRNIEDILRQSRSTMIQVARMLRAERTTIAAMRVLIAIERERLRSTHLPPSLEALGTDAFTTPAPSFTALVYHPANSGGFMLYAFGPDGADDGGKPGVSWFAADGTDAVFTLPRRSEGN